jgi:hypothetical protein
MFHLKCPFLFAYSKKSPLRYNSSVQAAKITRGMVISMDISLNKCDGCASIMSFYS